ncbi:MAG TPA: hypothetical protein VGE97_01820 [Nitrososphaera sp.]|jgi:hypothetical protein
MKTIIATVISIAFLMGASVFQMEKQQQPAFAISPYQSGFQHGVSDGKDSCLHPDGCDWYILKPGKGFISFMGLCNRLCYMILQD